LFPHRGHDIIRYCRILSQPFRLLFGNFEFFVVYGAIGLIAPSAYDCQLLFVV
jgi:hypothetical protein